MGFHADPRSTDFSLWGVSVICVSIATFQVCLILIPILDMDIAYTLSNTSVHMQLSSITAVVAAKNRAQLLFIIKKRISEKNRDTGRSFVFRQIRT